ncbi:hypothetical protein C8F04DRAFT_1064120 [Mycena alexandri]|uniref:Geranylgeranyl pyrophosphate synthetase n=1 Tax=Mycena alexandri TaxID=1745969 RepID=A0AAD6TLH9_9AGAR|nr:hypothetical protein C8F04DRAFT_1064120 [Mycena alexandri]
MYASSTTRRGRGTGRFSNSAPAIPLPPERDIMEGLHPTPLQTIAVPAITSDADNVVINNLESIGSYNWTKASSPTIIVPGSPPEWQNKAPPYQVPADTGIFFVDQNGFRMASAVLLPLIMAVDKTHAASDNPAAFDWGGENIDFVTDRNGLRKLMRWIDGAGADPPAKEFRIDTQLAGKTVLLNRREKRTRENFSGFTFGFNFEKASTDPAAGCEESSGHHRIVKYDLNGLKMVVRFEVDACIPTAAKSSAASATVGSIDDLAISLAGINITSKKTPASQTAHGLTVIDGGAIVPHSSIVELTTRSEKRQLEFDWKDAYPQLFFSQTPHHFLAVHNRGRFEMVNKRKLASSELRGVEQQIQPSLKKLRVALDTIKAVVLKHGQRGRLTLVFRGGKLQLFERMSQTSCLPDEVMARFED